MIIKNATYGNDKDVIVVEMGSGDIHMCQTEITKSNAIHLVFRTTEPQEINVTHSIEKAIELTTKPPEMVFIFNKIESIDSLISMLQDCKNDMLLKI